MFDIYVNENFLLRNYDSKKSFDYGILASLVDPTNRVNIMEKRWNTNINKMETVNYNIKNGIVYNNKNELVYSNKKKYKTLMKYKINIREVLRLAEYLHKINNLEFKTNYSVEFWYSISVPEAKVIEKELEQTIPIQNLITRLKSSINAIQLYENELDYNNLFSMELNDVVIEVDKINKKYPELDLKGLIYLE